MLMDVKIVTPCPTAGCADRAGPCTEPHSPKMVTYYPHCSSESIEDLSKAAPTFGGRIAVGREELAARPSVRTPSAHTHL